MNSYVAKALPVKYKITAHRPWHVSNKGCHSTVCKSALLLRATIAEGSMSWGGTIQWAIPFNKCIYPQWVTVQFAYCGKNIWLDRRGSSLQRVMGTSEEEVSRRYPSMSLSPGTDTEKPWDSTMEPFVLPKQLLLLLVGKVCL